MGEADGGGGEGGWRSRLMGEGLRVKDGGRDKRKQRENK